MTARAAAAPAREWRSRLSEPVSLARTLDFAGAHPRAFGAPAATTAPFVAGGFNGEVARGASCNCRSVTLIPHCNGTHTESVAHLTLDTLAIESIVPLQPVPAVLVTVAPVEATSTGEGTDPAPRPGDRVVTAEAIARAWPRGWPADFPAPEALVLRTGDGAGSPPPYLTREAAALAAARGIRHLVLELPSVDREDDGGRLAGHREFFGLPAASTALADAKRADCTVTELALVPASCRDGAGALQLQVTPWLGDAVPSRPLWFALDPA